VNDSQEAIELLAKQMSNKLQSKTSNLYQEMTSYNFQKVRLFARGNYNEFFYFIKVIEVVVLSLKDDIEIVKKIFTLTQEIWRTDLIGRFIEQFGCYPNLIENLIEIITFAKQNDII
jgi:hypothetical protein